MMSFEERREKINLLCPHCLTQAALAVGSQSFMMNAVIVILVWHACWSLFRAMNVCVNDELSWMLNAKRFRVNVERRSGSWINECYGRYLFLFVIRAIYITGSEFSIHLTPGSQFFGGLSFRYTHLNGGSRKIKYATTEVQGIMTSKPEIAR